MKLKFMTPRQVSKDQHRLKDKIEKERIEKEEIETSEGRENEEKEKEVERKMMENLFVNVFSSTVCDVILKEQEDKHVNETHQLPCMKRKLVHSAFGSLMRSKFAKHNAWSYLYLHIKVAVVLAREVLHGLQPLKRNKTKSIQVAFDPGGREIVSSCAQIKFFTRTYETFTKTCREIKAFGSG